MTTPAAFDMIESLEQFRHQVMEHSAVLVWFSAPTCRVCSELKPKVGEMIRRSYPRIALFEVNCEENRLTAAQQQVFAVPTLLLFLEGKEQLRRSRHFSPAELEREISRPYSLLFG